jgi:hypothetical protein
VVETLDLGAMAEEAAPQLGLQAAEAFREHEVADFGDGFPSGRGGGSQVVADSWDVVARDRVDLVKHASEEADFQADGAQAGLVGDGDLLDGFHFGGIAGVVGGSEVLAEIGDVFEVFELGDVVGVAVETVFAGVLGRTGFSLGGARTGGVLGVGAVRSNLLVGSGFGLG